MVIRHRDRVAVAQSGRAAAIRLQHRRIGGRRVPFHPLEKGRTEIEADLFEGVDDAEDATFVSRNSRGGHRAVALLLYSLIPVVEGSGGGFGFDLLDPRIFARWLVEVAVDDDPHTTTARLPSIAARTAGRISGNT